MEYCHRRFFDVRWTELDFKDELKPSALLSYAQEAAGTSADELGFGYDALRPRDMGFIIVASYCEIARPVHAGERVCVETWPLPPRLAFFERDYRIKCGEEVVAALASRWVLVDLNTFRLLSPSALGEIHERCPYNPEKSVQAQWSIPRTEGFFEAGRMRVLPSHCDHYLHANNTRYADFFFDCFSMEELAARRVKSFCIAYDKQAKPPQELTLLRKDGAGESILHAVDGDVLLSQCVIRFDEERAQ